MILQVQTCIVDFLSVIEVVLLGASLPVLVLQLARAAVHLVIVGHLGVAVVLRGGVFHAVCGLLLVVVRRDVKITSLVFKFDLQVRDAVVFRTVGNTGGALLVLVTVKVGLGGRLGAMVTMMASLAVAPVQVDAVGALIYRRFCLIDDHLRLVKVLDHVIILTRLCHEVVLA